MTSWCWSPFRLSALQVLRLQVENLSPREVGELVAPMASLHSLSVDCEVNDPDRRWTPSWPPSRRSRSSAAFPSVRPQARSSRRVPVRTALRGYGGSACACGTTAGNVGTSPRPLQDLNSWSSPATASPGTRSRGSCPQYRTSQSSRSPRSLQSLWGTPLPGSSRGCSACCASTCETSWTRAAGMRKCGTLPR
jgi:hypothetical protein